MELYADVVRDGESTLREIDMLLAHVRRIALTQNERLAILSARSEIAAATTRLREALTAGCEQAVASRLLQNCTTAQRGFNALTEQLSESLNRRARN